MTAARSDPQRDGELVTATRALLARPWRTSEQDPEIVALVRRHADALDAWFTQELTYRLVVTADTARLVKVGHVPGDRPLRTISTTPRPFTPAEYTALALVLAATTSGPDRTSLRDLVNAVHSAAAEAGIVMDTDTASRRALVTALRWLIAHGMVRELDRGVGLYEHDADADALLEVRNDRMALLPTGAVVGAESAPDLVARARERGSASTAARRRLVEDPVVLAGDLEPARSPSCAATPGTRRGGSRRAPGSSSRRARRASPRSTSTAAAPTSRSRAAAPWRTRRCCWSAS